MMIARLITLTMLVFGIAACGQVSTPSVDSATANPSTLPAIDSSLSSDWRTFVGGKGECAYTISYPPDMQNGTIGWEHSWILRYHDLVLPPPEAANNFIYISALPDGVETGDVGVILNYDPADVETLQNLEIGESITLRNGPNTPGENTFTRLPDTIIDNHVAQAYESTNSSQLPSATKEIRYYFRDDNCSYLIGAYLDVAESEQPGAITEELFEQIISTFDLIP